MSRAQCQNAEKAFDVDEIYERHNLYVATNLKRPHGMTLGSARSLPPRPAKNQLAKFTMAQVELQRQAGSGSIRWVGD